MVRFDARVPSSSFPIAVIFLCSQNHNNLQLPAKRNKSIKMMLQNGEAYSSMPWVIVAASLLPTEYWFLGRKPDLAGLFYGKAFSHSKNDFNTEGNSFGPLLNKTQSSHVSVQVSLGACVSLESNLFREVCEAPMFCAAVA